MNIDPVALSQLPFAAFLIALGLAVGWTGMQKMWVWGRELAKSEAEVAEWKAIATKATDTASVQSAQITKLTDMVDALTKVVGGRA